MFRKRAVLKEHFSKSLWCSSVLIVFLGGNFFQWKCRSRVHPCDFIKDELHHRDYLAWLLQGISFFNISENFLRDITVIPFTQEVVTLLKMTCLEYKHMEPTFSSKDNFNCVTGNVYIWMPMPMSRCGCRDFQMAFYRFIGDHLLCRTFKWLLLNVQR